MKYLLIVVLALLAGCETPNMAVLKGQTIVIHVGGFWEVNKNSGFGPLPLLGHACAARKTDTGAVVIRKLKPGEKPGSCQVPQIKDYGEKPYFADCVVYTTANEAVLMHELEHCAGAGHLLGLPGLVP